MSTAEDTLEALQSQRLEVLRRLTAVQKELASIDGREERVRARLPAEQRRKDRAHLDVLVAELSSMAATVPGEIDRMADLCRKVIAMDEEAHALAVALGARVPRRRLRGYCKILVNLRLNGPVLLVNPVKVPRPVGYARAAEEAFTRPWTVEETQAPC